MWLHEVPLRSELGLVPAYGKRAFTLTLAVGLYLACIVGLFAVSTATAGLQITCWRFVLLHVSSALAIFAVYGWETLRQHRAPRNRQN